MKTEPLEYFCDNRRHLVCKPYSRENMYAMAYELKIKECWFHKNHYDIPKKRFDEIRAKCIVVRPREILAIINGK